MQVHTATGDLLAALLEYPTDESVAGMASAAQALREQFPVTEKLELFCDTLAGKSLHELEELYTRTFDLNPTCTLEIGWQIFGEQYERGTFLVRMRETLRKFDIPEGKELPDHLCSALRVLARLEGVDADNFAGVFILPALRKMCEKFLKDNPYRCVLETIKDLVGELHPKCSLPEISRKPAAADLLKGDRCGCNDS